MANKRSGSVRDKEGLPVIISKDEMNLAEFPFTLLSRRAKAGQKTIEINQEVRDQQGRIVKQEWIVTGSDKYGLPLAIDEDIYVALMQLYKENSFREKRVHFSRYRMLRIIGMETSKKGYDRIEEALNRLVSVTIVSKNAFWDNDARMYASEAFHLFDSYRLYDERFAEKRQNQQSLPLSNVVMSGFLFDSIKAGYIKNLDTKFYFGLETPLSKRLYRYLDKKRYHKLIYEIGLLKLAALLPIQDGYPSQIKRRLDRSHTELIEKGFLKSYTYRKTRGGDKDKVIYTFPRASSAKHKDRYISEDADENYQPEIREKNGEDLFLKHKLVERGITELVAAKLVENHSPQQIDKQIEVFDWLIENNSPILEKNPPGFLRRAIEESYEAPAGYIRDREREMARGKREQEKIEDEVEQAKINEIQKRVDEYRERLGEHESQQLRQKALELIEGDKAIKKEFVTEFLIRAKEAEIIKERLGLEF